MLSGGEFPRHFLYKKYLEYVIPRMQDDVNICKTAFTKNERVHVKVYTLLKHVIICISQRKLGDVYLKFLTSILNINKRSQHVYPYMFFY